LNVLKGSPQITWATPADITYPTPLGDDQLNATANVPGSFAYTPAAGTVLNAGSNQVLSVSFTPADTNNYTGAKVTVSLNVLKAEQTIIFDPLGDRMVGETFNLTASASSGAPVTFEIVSGPAVFVTNTVLVTTVTVTNVGVVTIRASQAGTTNYNAAPDVLRSLTVSIEQPSLHITLSGGQFILSWPSSASEFTLESAATLQPRVTWATVPNGGVIVVVTNQLVSTSAFYRLRRQ
jgi:hypothetical protein